MKYEKTKLINRCDVLMLNANFTGEWGEGRLRVSFSGFKVKFQTKYQDYRYIGCLLHNRWRYL